MTTHCQACGLAVETENGLIARHRYQPRPRETTLCFGAGHRPYEVACDALPFAIRTVGRWLSQRKCELSDTLASPPDALMVQPRCDDGPPGEPVICRRPEGFDPHRRGPWIPHTYEAEFGIIRDALEADIRSYTDAVARLKERLDNWISPMSEGQLSEEWRKASLRYVAAVNAYVARKLSEGGENIGHEPEDDRAHLAYDVLNAVRRANQAGDTAALRTLFPPAWSPFLPIIGHNGRSLAPIAWIDNDRIAVHVGATSADGPIVVVGDDVVEQPQVLGFGQSPDGKLFGLAFDDAIEVRTTWDGPATTVLPWPSGQEGLPPGYCVNAAIDKAHITQLVVFPDGQRVLLALREGVFVVSRSGATRLLPRTEAYIEHFERLRKEYPNDPLSLTIDREHGAVSPHGDLVLAGCGDSKHIVFDRELRQIATLEPRAKYPNFAWFSADGKLAAFSACHTRGVSKGTSIAVPARKFADLDIDYYERHPSIRVLQEGDGVYAAVARDDEFIVGDGGGYLRAFDLEGNFRWRHFIGSEISALALNPDKQRLAVTSAAGVLCVLQLHAGERDPFAIGTATHRELQRWLFWKNEETPLRW
jgi:hypothetical protein